MQDAKGYVWVDVEADDVGRGWVLAFGGLGEPGPRNGRSWRRWTKITVERDMKPDAWGTETWKESDTEREYSKDIRKER